MSAIKTHDHWEVVKGGEIKLETAESEENAPIRVRAVRVSRTNPSLCELMTERTYMGGSISRTEHFVQQGHIQSTEPSSSTTNRSSIGSRVRVPGLLGRYLSTT